MTLNAQSLPNSKKYIANVQHFSTEDGLSHRNVQTTFQDSRGFIWVGTNYGLNRFNGKQFQTFPEKEGIALHYVQYIIEDADGWLWVFSTKSHSSSNNFSRLFFIHINTLEIKTVEERFGTDFPTGWVLPTTIATPQKTILFTTEKGKIIRFSS